MAGKEFVLQWSHNFKLEMVNSGHDINGLQLYPPVLKQFVWHCWPDIARAATTTVDTNWDTSWELLDLQKVEHDVLHTMHLGVAASLDAIQEHAEQELEEDKHDAEHAEQEQLPDIEEIYESDWTPASIPDVVGICNDQHQSAHDEICAESWEWVIAARAHLCKRSMGSNSVQ